MKEMNNGIDVILCQACINEYKGEHGEVKETVLTNAVEFSHGHVEGRVGKIGDLTVVVFRGSDGYADWFDNIDFMKKKLPKSWFGRKCSVHHGFFRQFNQIKDVVFELVRGHAKVVITGHSLGGAIATLFAVYMARHARSSTQIGCVTFGSPRVGDRAFKKVYDTIVPLTRRYVYGEDMVCKVPPSFRWWYAHVRTKVRLGKLSWAEVFFYIPRKIFGNPMDHKPKKYSRALKEKYENSHT